MTGNEQETIRKLRKIIDEQQDEIWQLKRALGFDLGFKLDVGLTETELRLFLVMAKDGSITHERGAAILLSYRDSKDAANLFRQHIHNMRITLRKVGIEVRNQSGVGYYLDTETLARVRPMMFDGKANGLDKTADRKAAANGVLRNVDPAGGRVNGSAAH